MCGRSQKQQPLWTDREGPGADLVRTKAGCSRRVWGSAGVPERPLWTCDPSFWVGRERRSAHFLGVRPFPDTGFPSRAPAPDKMASQGLRKQTLRSSPLLPPGPQVCPGTVGIVCCSSLPRLYPNLSLPCLSCPLPCAILLWLHSQMPLVFFLRSLLLR